MTTLGDLTAELPEGAGPLGILSGDEFTRATADFDRALLQRTGPRVSIIFCAGHDMAKHNARHARAYFRAMGADARALDVHSDGDPAEFDLMIIAGGSPKELLGCLLGSRVWSDVQARWRAGAGLAGASAGAMALSEHCLLPEAGAGVPTVWSPGLGPLTKAGLAVHASSRPRAWLDAITASAPVPVLALDDCTGVILQRGTEPTIVGSGSVWFAPQH